MAIFLFSRQKNNNKLSFFGERSNLPREKPLFWPSLHARMSSILPFRQPPPPQSSPSCFFLSFHGATGAIVRQNWHTITLWPLRGRKIKSLKIFHHLGNENLVNKKKKFWKMSKMSISIKVGKDFFFLWPVLFWSNFFFW